jgi:VanZ family protein
VFLIFSIVPITPRRHSRTDSQKPTSKIKQINPRPRIFIAGLMAFGVAIFDEIHQLYISHRDASIIDVVLDFIGISLAVALILKIYKSPDDDL